MKNFIFSFIIINSIAVFAAGNLEVLTEPEGAKIYVEFLTAKDITTDSSSLRAQDPRFQNGPAYAGTSPLLIEYIGVGKFKVMAELNGYKKEEAEALVLDEQTTSVKLKMEKNIHPAHLPKIEEKKSYRAEILMLSPIGKVPIATNLSEIIFQSPSGEKYIVDKLDIENYNLPPNFSGKINDIKYVIKNLKDKWSIVFQLNSYENYIVQINILNEITNKVEYSIKEKGAYNIVSIYSWEIE